MKNLILLLLLAVCVGSYAQTVRTGTVTVDGTSYEVRQGPHWAGGKNIELNSSGSLITPPYGSTVPYINRIPPTSAIYETSNTIHFRDSLRVNAEVNQSWLFYKSFYTSIADTAYRSKMIGFLKRDKQISKDYVE